MLQKIRDRTQGAIAKTIVGVIAVTFAVFGIDAFFTGGVPEAATVNGEVITEPELAQSVELERRRLLGEMQDGVDTSQLDEARLRAPVLESLIQRRLMLQTAERSGLDVGEAMLNRVIVEDENFQENGTFSQNRFRGLLASNGMSPAQFKQLLRQDILISQLMSGIDASEFVTEIELANAVRLTQQSLDARWLVVPVAVADDSIVVADADVAAYYERNRAQFRTEETVHVDYLELRLSDLFQPVPEDELRMEYERRVAAFEGGEERHAAHIMLADPGDAAREKLAALRARVLEGEDFAALARENSEDPGSAAQGGDLGFSRGDTFPAEFEAALKSLAPGEVSEPVKTASGWHLIKLLELRHQDPPTYAEMRPAIERDLQKAAAEPLFVERAEKLADLTFNSDDLAEASRELGLEIHTSPALSSRGGAGIFSNARVIAAAFGDEVLREKQNSERIDIGDDHAIVLRLKSHEPVRDQTLAEVASEIRSRLREEVVRTQAQARAQTLLAALASGQGIEELARTNGLEWRAAPGYTRAAPQVPSELGSALFDTPRDDTGSGRGEVLTSTGQVLVFSFDNFREGELARLPAEQRSLLRRLLRQAQGIAMTGQYQQSLRASASVELH